MFDFTVPSVFLESHICAVSLRLCSKLSQALWQCFHCGPNRVKLPKVTAIELPVSTFTRRSSKEDSLQMRFEQREDVHSEGKTVSPVLSNSG